jgi:amino acid transporter
MNMDTQSAAAVEQQELKRVLKLPALIFMGIAFISPGCILLYFGILNGLCGGHLPLVVAITMVAMLLTALSYAKMTKKYPVAGSVYSYVNRSINPKLGFVAGWAIMADYLLMPMICYLYFGLYLNYAYPFIPTWVYIVMSIAIVTIFNLLGVQVAARVDTVLSIIGIAFVAATIICSVIYIKGGGGTGSLWVPEVIYNPETFTSSGVLAASAILCVAFLGYDAVTTLAEDAIEPEKNIGKAVLGVCLGAGIGFIITAYFMCAAWPTAWKEIEDSGIALTSFYERIGFPIFNILFVWFNTIACIAISISAQLAVSRIMYGMGRDGFLPKNFFGYLHPRTRVPVKNILITSAVGLTAIIFVNDVTAAASLISFGALSGFLFVNLSVIF